MANIQHSVLDYSENHVAHAYQYSDATQRGAAAGFVAADVGKLALQLDDLSLWMLSDESPITWVKVIQTSAIVADTIDESTPAAGVTIDGVLIKDNSVTASSGFVGALTGNVTGNVVGNVTGNVSGNSGTVTNGVYTSGNQAIAGVKTFSSTIVGSISGNAATVTTVSTSAALAATAGAAPGAVGTYAFLRHTGGGTVYPGDAKLGANLTYANAHGDGYGTPSGTWQCMGYAYYDAVNNNRATTLWLRIA